MSPRTIEERLAPFRRFENPRTGVTDEFLPRVLGSNGLGILTGPPEARATTGFVICRSPGPEQGALVRLERLIAGDLAGRGFPTIRIRRGYRREGEPSDLSLSDSLAEAADAHAAIRERCGVERVGTIGTLLGAAAALELAVQLDLPLAALVCPIVHGAAYLRELYRRQLVTGFMTQNDMVERREPFEERLARGPILVRGLRVSRATLDEISALDLATTARRFAGNAFVCGVSRTGEPDEGVSELEASIAGSRSVAVVKNSLPVPVGEIFVRSANPGAQVDVRVKLDLELARRIAEWAVGAAT
jgi:pimeloyl-ACP methyl ester carboxylesterase